MAEKLATTLTDLTDTLAERWSDRAASVGVVLLISYDGDPGIRALLDTSSVLKIFDALIGRAIAETRGGGAIELSLKARAVNNGLILNSRVRDGGSRPDSTQLVSLFNPTGTDTTTYPKGPLQQETLSSAGKLISTMGGGVVAYPNPGQGATLGFDLLLDSALPSDVKQNLNKPSPALAHVLIVDDNATNRMVAEALCEMFDCTSKQAEHGLEALNMLDSETFDLVLMDVSMPVMDGIAATKAIRASSAQYAAIPIVALTANADPDIVRSLYSAGMDAVVEKPIKPDRLLEALDSLLPAGENHHGQLGLTA